MPNDILTKALEIAEAEYTLSPYRKRFIPIEDIARDPLKYGYKTLEHRASKARQSEFVADRRKITAVVAANRCLGEHQKIYNPVTNEYTKVSEITGEHYIYAFNGITKVIALAKKPFIKAKEDIYKVTFKNKQTLDVTLNHLILDVFGTYRPVSQLLHGASVCLNQSSLGRYLLIPFLSVQSFCQKAASSIYDYFVYSHQCDAQPHLLLSFDSSCLQQQSDAQEHSYCSCDTSSDLFYKEVYSHPCLFFGHLSILDALLHSLGQYAKSLFHGLSKESKLVGANKTFFQILLCLLAPLFLSIYAITQSAISLLIFLPFVNTSTSIIKHCKIDCNSNVWDFEVPRYNNYYIGGIVNHNSGKTESGAIKFIKNCLARKGTAWSLCPSYDLQKVGTQEKILDYLKPEQIVRKSYAVGTALKEIELINGTIISFKSYEQGREKLQSAKLITAWFDEEPSEEIYKEVYTRTVDMRGQIILTFTPLKGFTWSYEQIFNKIGDMVGCYSWGMADNPFIPLDEIEMLKGSLTWKQAQMRLYGKYMGSDTAVWQVFDRRLHINTEPMYDKNLPVDVTIDPGVVIAGVIFGQYQKVIIKGKMIDRFVIIDALELRDVGYSSMMRLIIAHMQKKGYFPGEYFSDPAVKQRQQSTRTGTSMLELIKLEFGVEFRFIKKLGIEESIEIVSSYMMNAKGEVRFYLDGEIPINDRGMTLAQRIENYVRDEDTHKPVDDDCIHCLDSLRYFVMNKIRNKLRGSFNQH